MAEPFVQFYQGFCEEQFCKIILNLDKWFNRRLHLKTFSYAPLFNGAEPLVQFW